MDHLQQYAEGYPEHLKKRTVPEEKYAEVERLREKLSRSSVTLGSSQERWPQEAYEALLSQHPWVSKLAVRTEMTASNDEGYGVGYFVLTPKDIPPHAAGVSDIAVVTLPIIVKGHELFPFDVFAYRGNFYPLSEERALRLLRVRDIFAPLDRRLREHDQGGLSSFLSTRDTARRRGFSTKLSAPLQVAGDAAELLGTVDCKRAVEKLSAFLDEVRNVGSLDRARRTHLRKHSHLVGMEVHVRTDGSRVRALWASHPETGLPQFDPWEDVALVKLSELVGDAAFETCVSRRHHFVNFNAPSELELAGRGLVQADELRAKVSEVRQKTSSLRAVRRNGVFPPYTLVGRQRDEVWTGRVLNPPLQLRSESYDHRILILSDSRIFEHFDSDSPVVVSSEEPNTQLPDEMTTTEGFSVFVWVEGGALMGLPVSNGFTVDGETLYPVKEMWSGPTPAVVAGPVKGLKRTFTENRNGQLVLHLPESAQFVHGGGYRAPDSVKTKTSSAALPAVPQPNGVLSRVGEHYRLPEKYSSAVSTLPSLSEVEARAALALAGVSAEAAEVLLASTEPVPFWADDSRIGFGSTLVKEAEARVQQRLRASENALREFRPYAELRGQVAKSLQPIRGQEKLSSDLAEISVAAALSLDFLNAANLHRFVDMIPMFEECLSALCALLVASRLGFDDVPEEPLQGAVRSLDTILKGLRAVQYALLT